MRILLIWTFVVLLNRNKGKSQFASSQNVSSSSTVPAISSSPTALPTTSIVLATARSSGRETSLSSFPVTTSPSRLTSSSVTSSTLKQTALSSATISSSFDLRPTTSLQDYTSTSSFTTSSSMLPTLSSARIVSSSLSILVPSSSSIFTLTTSSSVSTEESSTFVRATFSSLQTEQSSTFVKATSSSVETKQLSTFELATSSSLAAEQSSTFVIETSSPLLAEQSSTLVVGTSSSLAAEESSSFVLATSSSAQTKESSTFVLATSSSVPTAEKSTLILETSSSVQTEQPASFEQRTSSSLPTEESSLFALVTLSSVPQKESSTPSLATETSRPVKTSSSVLTTSSSIHVRASSASELKTQTSFAVATSLRSALSSLVLVSEETLSITGLVASSMPTSQMNASTAFNRTALLGLVNSSSNSIGSVRVLVLTVSPVTTLSSQQRQSTILDPCSFSPCQNGAACVSKRGKVKCFCTRGYSGKNCTTKTIAYEVRIDFFYININGTRYTAVPPLLKDPKSTLFRRTCKVLQNSMLNIFSDAVRVHCKSFVSGGINATFVIEFRPPAKSIPTAINKTINTALKKNGFLFNLTNNKLAAAYVNQNIIVKDFNECEDPSLAVCHSTTICTNTRGSFSCHCSTGKRLHGNFCVAAVAKTASELNAIYITIGVLGCLLLLLMVLMVRIILRRRRNQKKSEDPAYVEQMEMARAKQGPQPAGLRVSVPINIQDPSGQTTPYYS